MFQIVTSATVTAKVTRAPSVKGPLNAPTNEACSTRSMASPPRVAMNEAGVPSINRVNDGASSPNRTASSPQMIPAVYWRGRRPGGTNKGVVGPRRQGGAQPPAPGGSDQAPPPILIALVGGGWPGGGGRPRP